MIAVWMPKESVSFHPQNYIFYKLPLDCFRPHRQVTPLTQPWTRPCKLSNGLSPWRRNDAEDSSLCGWLDKTPTKIIEKNCFCGPEECSSRNRTESITIYRMQDRDHLQDSSLISLTDEVLATGHLSPKTQAKKIQINCVLWATSLVFCVHLHLQKPLCNLYIF